MAASQFQGMRVVPGNTWAFDGVDQNEIGTIIKYDQLEGKNNKYVQIGVAWDSGTNSSFMYPKGYEVHVVNTDILGVQHAEVCNFCSKRVVGILWKCAVCDKNIHLCSICYHGDKHSTDHKFYRIDMVYKSGVIRPERKKSKKISLHGICYGATVIDRDDEKSSDGDTARDQKPPKRAGSKSKRNSTTDLDAGRVIGFDFRNKSWIAQVKWNKESQHHSSSLAEEFVISREFQKEHPLKCTKSKIWFSVYRDHLPEPRELDIENYSFLDGPATGADYSRDDSCASDEDTRSSKANAPREPSHYEFLEYMNQNVDSDKGANSHKGDAPNVPPRGTPVLVNPENYEVSTDAIRTGENPSVAAYGAEASQVTNTEITAGSKQDHVTPDTDKVASDVIRRDNKAPEEENRLGIWIAHALHNVSSTKKEDLDFIEGDIIFDITHLEEGWMYGYCNGESGKFLKATVEIEEISKERYQKLKASRFTIAKMTSTFNSSNEGDMVFDVKPIEGKDGWMCGTVRGQRFEFPTAFAETKDITKEEYEKLKADQRNLAARFSITKMTSTFNSLNEGDMVFDVKPIEGKNGWMCGTHRGKQLEFPTAFAEIKDVPKEEYEKQKADHMKTAAVAENGRKVVNKVKPLGVKADIKPTAVYGNRFGKSETKGHVFEEHDVVMIGDISDDEMEEKQLHHGGIYDFMNEIRGKKGVVVEVLPSNDVIVDFKHNRRPKLNPAILKSLGKK